MTRPAYMTKREAYVMALIARAERLCAKLNLDATCEPTIEMARQAFTAGEDQAGGILLNLIHHMECEQARGAGRTA